MSYESYIFIYAMRERGRQIWRMMSKLLNYLNSVMMIVKSSLFHFNTLTRLWKLLAQITLIDKFNTLIFYYKFWHSNSWIGHFARQQDNTIRAIHFIHSSLVYFPTTTTTTRRCRVTIDIFWLWPNFHFKILILFPHLFKSFAQKALIKANNSCPSENVRIL